MGAHIQLKNCKLTVSPELNKKLILIFIFKLIHPFQLILFPINIWKDLTEHQQWKRTWSILPQRDQQKILKWDFICWHYTFTWATIPSPRGAGTHPGLVWGGHKIVVSHFCTTPERDKPIYRHMWPPIPPGNRETGELSCPIWLGLCLQAAILTTS